MSKLIFWKISTALIKNAHRQDLKEDCHREGQFLHLYIKNIMDDDRKNL